MTANTQRVDVERLSELLEKATPGPWEVDPIDKEGGYGPGPDPRTGFKSFAIYDERGLVIMDSLNSEVAMVEECFSGDRVYAWDDVALNNANLIVAAVNVLPTLLQKIDQLNDDLSTARQSLYECAGQRNDALSSLADAERARDEACGLLREADEWLRNHSITSEFRKRVAAFLAANK